MKRALITGVTGQDGSYLAEFLLDKGYEVSGMVRRASTETYERISHIRDRIALHQADLLDQLSLVRVLEETRPTEIYNLAAQSHVKVSFEPPEYTANSDAIGALRLLEAIRILKTRRSVRKFKPDPVDEAILRDVLDCGRLAATAINIQP